MTRKPRSEQRFSSITYSQIAAWTGLALGTVRAYSGQGVFDPRDFEATMQWVNERRLAKGIPMIGVPEPVAPTDSPAV